MRANTTTCQWLDLPDSLQILHPGDIDAWIDWRDWLDEICGYWGAESTSVEALDASIHVKGFPSPGCFGTGGNDDSETADSRAARRIANEQDAQARADS